MGAFREAFIVARLFDGMDVCERIFGQLSSRKRGGKYNLSFFERSMRASRLRRDGTTRTENSRHA
jgi:hypothetical protein